jgi:hypothetical protein
MEIVLYILIAIAALVAVFAAFAATRPSAFRVARSATMNASAADVFAQVNDFHKWEHWSPWLKIDPSAKATFEGPESGVGAIFRWDGNNEVGAGSMTLTESHPYDRIRIRLDFLKPFAGTSDVEFSFKPEGQQTSVTWAMAGHHNFIVRALCLFMNMDKMIGDKYEEGLASMKGIVEGKR